jgi:hypothetical protein
MQRSKQQALMFLLGAVLVGGVLGFSADHVLNDKPKHWVPRMRMYDDLGLSAAQRTSMDSVLDERNCQIGALMKPVRPQLDSIKAAAHQQVVQILTPEQRQLLDRRIEEMATRDSARAATKTTPTCK